MAFIIPVIGAVASAVAGMTLTQFVFVAYVAYTVIDALTNGKQNPVDAGGFSSPTYSFGKLQTQVSNLMVRPIIYGEVKVAGNKIWQNGENTATIQQIISFCDGEIEGSVALSFHFHVKSFFNLILLCN